MCFQEFLTGQTLCHHAKVNVAEIVVVFEKTLELAVVVQWKLKLTLTLPAATCWYMRPESQPGAYKV